MEKELEKIKKQFLELYGLNVNKYTENKNGLKYLSWAYAWAEFKKIHPDANYEIKKFENNMPFIYDEVLGYMVFTSVTAGGLTYEMWLPVMDSANKSMKAQPYTYDTKYKKGLIVDAATMFDINKTIMRCLVKNLAMFGLGLYIYAGEDLPEEEKTEEDKGIADLKEKVIDNVKADAMISAFKAAKMSTDEIKDVLKKYGYTKVIDVKVKDYASVMGDIKA